MASFPNSYQIRLLALLCIDKQTYLKHGSFIEDTMFSTAVSQWVFNKIKEYYTTYRKPPTRNVFDTELSKEDAWRPLPEEQPLLQEFLALLSAGSITDEQYIKDTVLQYMSAKAMRNVLSEQTENVDNGEFDDVLAALRKTRKELLSKEGGLVDENGELFSLKNLEPIYLSNTAIKTGSNLLDHEIKGVVAKELTMVLADTSIGKSVALSQMGSFMVKNHHKVLHVTLEMSAPRVLARYLSMLSVGYEEFDWLSINDILDFQPDIRAQVFDYVVKFLKPKFEGYLSIEELPTGKGTIEQISGLVELRKPEVLIVDYLDLLRPPKSRQDYRFELKDITTQLRAVGVEQNLPVITATQANRNAVGKRIVRKDMVAEDYEKIRIADTAFSIGQSQADADVNKVLFYLIKARNADREKAEFYRLNKKKIFFEFLNEHVIDRRDDK